MRDRARPSSLSPASSRIAPTDSSRARSMKAQVLATRQSASTGVAATSTPARASMPSMSSESTWFLGQPSVVRCTFMAGRHYIIPLTFILSPPPPPPPPPGEGEGGGGPGGAGEERGGGASGGEG